MTLSWQRPDGGVFQGGWKGPGVFFLNPETKISTNRFCRFRENSTNAHFNSKKWRHRTKG